MPRIETPQTFELSCKTIRFSLKRRDMTFPKYPYFNTDSNVLKMSFYRHISLYISELRSKLRKCWHIENPILRFCCHLFLKHQMSNLLQLVLKNISNCQPASKKDIILWICFILFEKMYHTALNSIQNFCNASCPPQRWPRSWMMSWST